jgi:serine/threonine protein kinase
MLGRYRLRGVLGQGGMGRLYVAEQEGIEGFSKIVALKQILPHLADSPQFRRMFLTEARVAARLDHPNIVVTYELGETGGVYFMSMEYLPGEDLGAVMARCRESGGPMPVETAAAIAHQALSGLQYAHDLRDNGRSVELVHRDVNPSNIFVTYYGMVKLLDFGVVKGNITTATSPGTFKGKYAYCAPEQLTGEAVDRRTDVFCVGIVLWECLTGQTLFKGSTDAAVIDAVRSQPILPPSGLRRGLPPELEQLTMKALARQPQERFQSAFEMSEAVDRFLSHWPRRPTSKTIGLWLEQVFGAPRATLKKTLAQGGDIEGALAQLAAMGGVRAASSEGANAGSGAGASKPSVQPRSLWSTSVRKTESEVRPGSAPALARPAAGGHAFIGIGGEGDERPEGGATSRFLIPPELAEAAGLSRESAESTDVDVPLLPEVLAALPGPGTFVPPPGAPAVARRASGGRAIKIIAVLGSLGAAGVLALTLRDTGTPASSAAVSVSANAVSLELKTDPPGAHLLLDGEPTALSTPTVLRNLRLGRVLQIQLDKAGYQTAVQRIQLDTNGPMVRTFKLVAAGGTLLLEGLPTGASVYLDDVLTEVWGPLAVPLGSVKLRVENEGEVILETVLDVRAGEQRIKLPARKQ